MLPARSRSTVWRYNCCASGAHARRDRSPFSFPVSTSMIVAGVDSVSFDASTAGDGLPTANVSANRIHIKVLRLTKALHHEGRGGHGAQILTRRIVPPVLCVHRGGEVLSSPLEPREPVQQLRRIRKRAEAGFRGLQGELRMAKPHVRIDQSQIRRGMRCRGAEVISFAGGKSASAFAA